MYISKAFQICKNLSAKKDEKIDVFSSLCLFMASFEILGVGDSEPSYVSQNNFLIFYIILNLFFMYSLYFIRKSLYEWFLEMDRPKFWMQLLYKKYT